MTVTLETLPREPLVAVAHEYMLLGMLSNQATLPQTIMAGGTLDDLNDLAIDLWMGASPVYTHRMRALMGIEGDDVPTIMKALQLDVGFVHQYMYVHYLVNDPLHGEFWLEHCGALLNVEPHGEERVFGMCHTIEDPTFDATAYATNPRARIRPLHRPPRVPADREPHCHWTIIIDPDNEPVGPARLTQQVADLPLASIAIEPRPDGDGYQGAFDPDFRLTATSDATLVALAREFGTQTHLLMCSAEIALSERFGAERARDLMADAWLATSWSASERLAKALRASADGQSEEPGIGAGVARAARRRRRQEREMSSGDGVDADVATVLALHPAIPSGFERSVTVDGDHVRLTLTPESSALLDPDQPGWIGALARTERRGIEGMVQPIDGRARVIDMVVSDGSVTVDVHIDPQAEPVTEPDAVAFMRIGMLGSWKFEL